MSNEYNSQLISKLYLATKIKDEERYLEEMAEIGDPIFIYPIFDKWKIHNNKESFISHYFISTLKNINSIDVLKVAIQIQELSKSLKDITWVYDIFIKYNYNSDKPIEIAKQIIVDYSNKELKETISEYQLADLLKYLVKTKQIGSIKSQMKNIVLDEENDINNRRLVLSYLFRVDPTNEMQWFIDNYETYKSDDLDILLAKEIVGWHNEIPEKLKNLIEIKGNSRSIEIIAESRKQNQKKVEEKLEAQTNKYGNISLILEINELRSNINQKSVSSSVCGFKLFNDSEFIIKQQESVISKEALIARSIELRQVFQEISDKTLEHRLTENEIKKLLPDLPQSEWNKPINRLFLFLKSLGLSVNSDIYGLRLVNRIVSLTSHPENEKSLIALLKENNLYSNFQKQEWGVLHKEILIRYKSALVNISKLLDKLPQ